ncbi:MAG: primosomal protein N' [Oscillospiraceae bacterium]|nr:primosomal protein N' [Oscillospiraceae bacterium]
MAYEKYIAAVAVSNTTFGYDRRYKYLVPVDLEGRIFVGVRVIVPFGKGNRKRIGVVIRIDNVSDLPDGENVTMFKPLRSVIDNEPLLNAEMLELMMWIRETTLCTYFEAFRTLIPIGLSVNYTSKYIIAEDRPSDTGILSEEARKLWDTIQNDIQCLDEAKVSVIKELEDKGFLTEKDDVKRRRKDETIKMLRLTEKYIDGEVKAELSEKQRAVAELLESCGAAAVKEINYICGVTSSVINTLKKKDVVEAFEYETIIEPKVTVNESADDIILSDEQQQCFDGISALIDAEKPDASLLYGVTGSGKTAVFIKLIQYVLEKQRNVIMLIPEISLTPQVVEKFTSLFGDLVSVMHSNLSLSQRLNEFKRVKSGRARIVVGTRSAVFAPLDNIGLIIMDEEGERTYKSESSPRYNAKDIAKKRCVTHNAVLLMASATPSVESYYYALKGRYKLFTMTKRYSRNHLPSVEIIDLATEGFYGSSSTFSERLVDEININLERKEQVILLLNRRGYYTFISCCDCKAPVICPNCSVPLTYHKVNNKLMCHYCGHMQDMISACPQCGKNHLKLTGIGTQKVEDEISRLFPDARILRMDADTTYSRYAYEKNFKAFENGEYDIMLGTQMIAKGLDFPNVTLVGVVSIDKALFSGDFRSYERTFSLLTQSVGRCGRGEKQGRAFIQTYVPNHYVINLAAEQNYVGFFDQELEMRKALIYPPFCDTCMFEFSSEMDRCADTASRCFMNMIREKIEKEKTSIPLRVLEPSRCTYEKLNGKFRYRIIIKCRNNAEFRKFIGDIYKKVFKMKEFANVQTTIDINGDISL